jgi:hypothetical protein
MRLANFKLIFVLVIFMTSLLSNLSAQEPEESQRDYVKKQVQYNRWKDILESKPEIIYDEFKLDNSIVSPWRIQRVQEIGVADYGNMIQYVLAKSDDVGKAEEILLISVTRCPTRTDAAERLIDHLLGVQRPDLKLIEEDIRIIGDLAVNIPGNPESAIFFLRGNILINVENAGKKAAADIRLLAQTLDENLKKKQR